MTTPSSLTKPKNPGGTLLLIGSFVLVAMILFDIPKGIRDGMGWAVGLIFDPILGFDLRYPLLTIFLASVVLVIATTAIRHFLIDWVNMARVQEAMRAFQKEFMQARKDNNTYKIKKLTDAQPEIMQLQASMSTEQMKPLALTMILVIPIFAWLGTFVLDVAALQPDDPCGPYLAVPWDATWDLGAHTREACPEGYAKLFNWITPMPHWIMIYSLFGIPFGQIAQRALKLWEYRHVDLDGDGVPAGETARAK